MTTVLQTRDALLIRDRISELLSHQTRDRFRHAEAAYLKRKMDSALARERGWIVARQSFGIAALKRATLNRRDEATGITEYPELDHVVYFREAVRPYRPAAVITHAYCPAGEVIACANAHGLMCEVLPWSWHFPGSCVAAILTRRTGTATIIPFRGCR